MTERRFDGYADRANLATAQRIVAGEPVGWVAVEQLADFALRAEAEIERLDAAIGDLVEQITSQPHDTEELR